VRYISCETNDAELAVETKTEDRILMRKRFGKAVVWRLKTRRRIVLHGKEDVRLGAGRNWLRIMSSGGLWY
jgi:hypothetical protein